MQSLQRINCLTSNAAHCKACLNGPLVSFGQLNSAVILLIEQGDITIVVDDTDWGYRIGEIEIVLTDSSQVTVAVQKIEDLAKQLSKFTLVKYNLFKKQSSYVLI